ncbi:MAG: ABC transporter substrate-binding protein [Clostridia bacterium]|nr:ABC transporter substrate-binding protein [Clostridia bacterium]
MKLRSWILAAVLLLVAAFGLTACAGNGDGSKVNVAVLQGPTGLGSLYIIKDAQNENSNYNVSVVGAVDEITPKLVKGELDIAAVPANVASVLYNNTKGKVRVIAVNTLGVLYIVTEGDDVNSIADLAGKTIISSGAGASPEYVLKYILEANGILDKVNFEWKSQHAECVTALKTTENAVALLPQPFVTAAMNANANLKIAIDLNEEWNKTQALEANPSALIMGVYVARTEFIENNPEAVNKFLSDYNLSQNWVNDNVDAAAELSGEYGVIATPIAKKAIPYCNITCITGDEMQTKLSGYLQVLYDFSPVSVGSAMPDEQFYYRGLNN